MPAQISAICTALGSSVQAEKAAAEMQEQDLLCQIMQGYDSDPWFSKQSNLVDLELYNGLYYKGNALIIPDDPDLKMFILKKLHDANNSGHVGYHKTQHKLLVARIGN